MTLSSIINSIISNVNNATSHIANLSNPHGVTKTQVGLSNVNNTSDASKPVSTAGQTALDLKANLSGASFTGNISASQFSGSVVGNASTATTLQTSRTIAGVGFNGSANINIPFSGLSSTPTTLTGYGITNAQSLNANLTSISGLSTASTGLVKMTNGIASFDLNTYLIANQIITVSGDATGSGTTGIALTLANSGVAANTYGSSTNIPQIAIDSKGRITSASNVAVSIPSGSISVTGGDITMSGNTGTAITNATLSNSGVTAGTYTKITVDAKGRVTAGAALIASDVPTLNQNTTGNAATATLATTATTSNALNTGNAYTGASFNGVTGLSVSAPLMDGAVAIGTSSSAARADHVHGSDTSKQDALVSATNIKTINGTSVLGSGDLSISIDPNTILTVPSTIPLGHTVTIDAGRTAILPNTVVAGTLNVNGTLFIPSGTGITQTTLGVNASDGKTATITAPSGMGSNQTFTLPSVGGLLAPLVSPALTGIPTAPTPTAGDNSTKVATTAYVDGKMVLRTSVASTSGTAIDFTGIPPWAKRITVMFNGVSTSGTSAVQVQLGSGSITTSGYLSNASSSGTTISSTSGLVIFGTTATDVRVGVMIIYNVSPNNYIATGVNLTGTSNIQNMPFSGNVSLSGTLDRLLITTVNGTDTFDAGSINIMYEG